MLRKLTCIVFVVVGILGNDLHHRSKRYLLFTANSQLQFSTGLTVPVVLPRRSINFSIVAQANYLLPYNSSNFEPSVVSARDKEKTTLFNMNRELFYKYSMEILDSFGLDGESCLLRSICEISEFPMHIREEEETLLEDIVYYVFTPSISLQLNNTLTTSEERFTSKLLRAEEFGKSTGNCEEEYSDCIVSIVDLFTKKYMV